MKFGIITFTALILLNGCNQPEIENKNESTIQEVKQTYLPPPPPEKVIELKDVNDTNFDAAYMYPQTSQSKKIAEAPIETPAASTDTMDKAQCIAMITQEKFDKYAAMFGSEDASIKRCKMLKAASL